MGTGASSWLVGREEDLAGLRDLVESGGVVTVTGPGGVGKTTLVHALASALREDRRVLIADLSGVERSAAVEPAVAAALGQSTVDAIRPENVVDGSVLVVDNCEHVLDAAAAAVASLRALVPGVTVCATSRQPLGLRDEVVLALDPLALPPRRVVDPEASSVRLFLAVAERAGGAVRDDDLREVCALCRRLDGVPLAIEIAATRTRSLSAGEILERLGDRLDTLGQGGFRRDERQRTVRDTVLWSYHLLDPPDRVVFDRLGVLAGSFPARTAHAVAGDGPLDGTLDRLDGLVAASLLSTTRGLDGGTWYHQLHAVRACAREHLRQRGELAATMERFVDHMADVASALNDHARTGWSRDTLVSITALQDSLLQALAWTVRHDDQPGRAFEITTILWGHQTRSDEVLEVGRRVLERWPDRRLPRWADAAATVATCLWITGQRAACEALVDRALEVAEAGRVAPVLLRRVRGQVLRRRGRLDDALGWFHAAADEARRRDLLALVFDAELLRAATLAERGEIDEAIAIAQAMRAEAEARDNEVLQVLALAIESDAMLWRDPATAGALARRGTAPARRWYPATTVGFTRIAAVAAALQGELGAAATLVCDSIDIMRRHGTLNPAGTVLEAAAVVAHRAGRDDWRALAAAAANLPSAPMLKSLGDLLPARDDSTVPPRDIGTVLRLASELMTAIAEDAGRPEDASAAPSPAAGASVLDEPARWSRSGDHWEIAYAGRTVTVSHRKGLEDLARLLAAPEAEIPAMDLIGAAVTSDDTGEVLDADARRQYERRIRELQAELAEAEDHNDIGRVEIATAELDALVDELSAAVGLGGRTRRTGGTSERARTAVTRRIRTAIAHLSEHHPELGRHLDAAIQTGTYCAYRPERPVSWRLG